MFFFIGDFVLAALSRLSASTEVNLSSTRETGRRKRPSSCLAKRSMRRASGWTPCSATGRPTTKRAGCHSSTSFSICVKPPTAGSGCVVPSSASPTATPIRLRPKSKARMVPRSGMSRFVLQLRKVDAEELHRRRQALFGGRVENDAVARLDREPGVLRQLVLELSRRPSAAAQRHQEPCRALAAPHRLEDVLGGG